MFALKISLFSVVLLFLTTLSACVSLEQKRTLPEPNLDHSDQLSKLTIIDRNIIEERTAPEPEQTVAEEVKGLQALGEWEEGQPAQVTEEAKIRYDFPITINKHVEFYLDFFQNKQRRSFTIWLERSGRYVPMIEKKLRKAGLPLDLAFLPMIESGYKLTAYSRARAAGPWQFMQATGRSYGLNINSYLDERRSPVKSTKAAIAFLQDLYNRFGCWHLAVAGYNAGEGKIGRAMRKYNSRNFWKIAQGNYLATETKRYVPRLIAAIIIARNPEKYGFTNIQFRAPLAYETIGVPRWTSIKAVAAAGNIDFKELRELNRELRRLITPPDHAIYPLKVPKGTKTVIARNLPRVQPTIVTSFKDHVVKAGDTITNICRRYNLNKTTLLKANNLRKPQLFIGQRLRIPYQTTKYKLLPKHMIASQLRPADAAAGSMFLHKVQPGETISALAIRYKVAPHMIGAWNNLNDLHSIRVGQQLAFYLHDVRTKPEKEVDNWLQNKLSKRRPALKSSQRIAAIPQKQPETTTTYYQVRKGDTLWSIARKHQLTPKKIKKWNNLTGNIIHPGLRLLLRLTTDLDV